MEQFWSQYRKELDETLAAMDGVIINRIALALEDAILKKKTVFVLGNGGSAAAATHWVCDFNKGVGMKSGVYPRFVSLADMLGVFTAIGNDLSYGEVFRQQLVNFLQAGDIVLALSVSGNSENLLQAAAYAKEQGAQVISILGDYQGKLEALSDIVLTIPSRNYGIVEDIHMSLDHAISQHLMRKLGGEHA